MSGLIQEMESVVMEVVDDDAKAREVVSRIIRRFGGGAVYLPAEHYEARNSAISELVNAGADPESVASRYRLHVVTVKRIVRRYNESKGQAVPYSVALSEVKPVHVPRRRGRPRKQK